MKNLITEFKKFITRGNVIDMSVGVIVGGAFTAIVNGMGNFILKPIVNAILALAFGSNSLSDIYTFLRKAYIVDAAGRLTEEVDLVNSIYIDWGSFINAVLNFFIIAVVLFLIVKVINSVRDGQNGLKSKLKLTGDQHKELMEHGIKVRDKKAVAAYFAEKQRLADEAAAAEAAAAAEKARLEREANPSTEDLLKQILAEMKKQNESK